MKKLFLKDNESIKGYVEYEISKDVAMLYVVYVDEAYRGQGIGKELMDLFVDFAKTNNLKISLVCPYAAKYFKEHKELTYLLKN